MLNDRIHFRAFQLNDTKRLFNIYSNKDAMKYRGSKPMQSIGDALDFVKKQVVDDKKEKIIRLGIELSATDELIGSVMFRYPKRYTDVCEIGYSIGFEYWGIGLGKEAVKLILEKVTQDSVIRRINAWSHRDNIASIKILESFGFEQKNQERTKEHLLFVKRSSL